MKTDFIRARIEPTLKENVHGIFGQLGVTPTEVITLLYKQVLLNKGLPFDISIPNQETARAIREARNRKGVVVAKDKADLFKKLGL